VRSILQLLLILFTIISCKKDGKETIQNGSTLCQIVEIRDKTSSSYLTYDSTDRVIKVTYGSTTVTYEYHPDKVIVRNGNKSNSYLLNSSGLVQNLIDGLSSFKFHYNSDGFLISDEYADDGLKVLHDYAYTNGNLTEISRLPTANYPFYSITISYKSDLNSNMAGWNSPLYMNRLGSDSPLYIDADRLDPFDRILVSGGYFGNSSKNLPGGYVKQGIAYGYDYEYDSKGNIITLRYSNGGEKIFAYKCK
jgi:hypothetical protein